MGKFSFCGGKNLDIPEDVINEIIILHSLGVGIEELKYLLELRLSNAL